MWKSLAPPLKPETTASRLAPAPRIYGSNKSVAVPVMASVRSDFLFDDFFFFFSNNYSAEQAMEAARAAVNGGITVLEIVRSTPGVFEVLQALVNEYPTKAFGVGTVLTAEDAKTAIKAGAKFLMSPATVNDIIDTVQDADVLYIPGAMTPTEIFSAHNAGAKIVKIYPVSALGGVRYISAIMKPFSHIPMVASQGITIDSVGDYIAHGAISVILSDAIFSKEAMNQNNFNAVNQLAKSAALQGKNAVERKKR
ncbi:hypothetical protein V6N11_070264 [Hibiscus sabdariffa]|uniref:Uncharacterized protein n=1 Tax=Hibiscus sabdariffa TaxID=183260 RepID=A0ABR2QEH5_9ROSI